MRTWAVRYRYFMGGMNHVAVVVAKTKFRAREMVKTRACSDMLIVEHIEEMQTHVEHIAVWS